MRMFSPHRLDFAVFIHVFSIHEHWGKTSLASDKIPIRFPWSPSERWGNSTGRTLRLNRSNETGEQADVIVCNSPQPTPSALQTVPAGLSKDMQLEQMFAVCNFGAPQATRQTAFIPFSHWHSSFNIYANDDLIPTSLVGFLAVAGAKSFCHYFPSTVHSAVRQLARSKTAAIDIDWQFTLCSSN